MTTSGRRTTSLDRQGSRRPQLEIPRAELPRGYPWRNHTGAGRRNRAQDRSCATEDPSRASRRAAGMRRID